MIPESTIFEVTVALLVILNINLELEIAEMDCFWFRTVYWFKKIASKTQG